MIGIILSLLAMFPTTETMTVRETTTEIVTCEDSAGDLWDFYGNGYETGTEITVVMVKNQIVEVK